MADRTKVIGYVRVSLETMADHGVSLDAQRAKIQAYANLYDLDLVDVVQDPGASGRSLARPGLQAALARLDAGEAHGLLVAKLDRLTRQVSDLAALLDRGFQDRFALLSVAENVDTRSAGGRLVLNLLCSVGQWERECLGERTADALAHLRTSGVKLGGEALGWVRGEAVDEEGRRVVVQVEGEAATVSRIIDLRAEGLSLRQIAAKLVEEGRPTKRGGAWHPPHPQTVAKVLRRSA